jgi:hypothetical protein
MDRLESLEQELAIPLREALDGVIPEPNSSRLLEIEQAIIYGPESNFNWLMWIALLLGITGFASAYYLTSGQKIEQNGSGGQEEVLIINSSESSPPSKQQTYKSDETGNPTIIYRQEVLDK